MEKLISCCGINCATCDARIATVSNDNELRAKTAENWSIQFSAAITAEMINCMGCREEGVKFAHCNECEIRKCAKSKGYQTCGNCSELSECKIIAPVLGFLPEAVENLKSLN
jgi:hypothetical protein